MRRYVNDNVANDVLQRVVTFVVNSLKNVTSTARAEITSEIEEAWRKMASSELEEKHSQRYLKGIQAVEISDKGKLSLKLKGHEAVQIERGWRPPDTHDIADGLGKYDGSAHDMRPFLLWGSKDWTGKSGKGAKLAKRAATGDDSRYHYKRIKMTFPTMKEADITASMREYLDAKVNDGKLSTKHADALQDQFEEGVADMIMRAKRLRRKRRRDASGQRNKPGASLKGDAVAGVPISRTVLWSETQERIEIIHRKFMFANMRAQHVGPNKFKFTNIRTISDNPRQAHRWHAIGIAPAFFLQDEHRNPGPLINKIVEILVKRGIAKMVETGGQQGFKVRKR